MTFAVRMLVQNSEDREKWGGFGRNHPINYT